MSETSAYKHNRLSIFILQDGFSFLLLNEWNSALAFECYKIGTSASTSELLKILKQHITSEFILNNNVVALEVIYANPQFSIVPDAYFEESHLPHYIKYSSQLIEGDDFSFDEIPSIQAKTVYIPYININNYLFDIFGTFQFTHLFTRLIQKGINESVSYQELAKVHVANNSIYFAAFQNQKLLLANSFAYETPEDLVYYILFSIEELGLNREELSLSFTGKFQNSETNEALSILKTYIRHISFSNTIGSLEFDNKEGFHDHFNLL